jgi:hypothetical protein
MLKQVQQDRMREGGRTKNFIVDWLLLLTIPTIVRPGFGQFCFELSALSFQLYHQPAILLIHNLAIPTIV